MILQPGKIALAPDEDETLLKVTNGKSCGWLRRSRPYVIVLSFFALGYALKTSIIPAIKVALDRHKDDRNIPLYYGSVLGECANWTVTGGVAEAELQMDLESLSDIRFYTQGSLPRGDITFVQSKRQDRKAIITVNTIFDDPKFLDYVKVCVTGHRPPSWMLIADANTVTYDSFGILSVPWLPRQKGSFSITVDLPLAAEIPLHFERFTSTMESFSHHFRDLTGVGIDTLMVYAHNSPVRAESLTAKKIHISTRNAAIQGTFRASYGLMLMTDNAPIDVALHLHNVERSKVLTSNLGVNPRLRAVLTTSKGHIRANTTLTSEVVPGGEFDVFASTSLGEVDINFADMPVRSSLWLTSKTIFNRINVSVPPTYEGNFTMNALYPFQNLVDTRLADDAYPPDPTGKGRPRVLWVFYEWLFRYDGGLVWDHRSRGDHGEGNLVMTSIAGSTRLVF